jgi:hypothetical protein
VADVNATAQAALDRLARLMAPWPKPGAGQGVKTEAVLTGVTLLRPLAEMLLRLPLGYAKSSYRGAGYLSGSDAVTATDQAIARAVLNDAVDLAATPGTALTRAGYAKVKERAYQLLNIAADLDVGDGELAKVGTALGPAWDRWASLDMTVTLPTAAAGAAPRVGPMPAPVRAVVDNLLAALARNGFIPESVAYDEAASRTVTVWFWTDFAADGARPIIPFSLAIDGRITPFVVSVVPTDAAAGSVANKAEAALQRFDHVMNSFPRPGPGQIVRRDALTAALKQLEPLADRVANLAAGTPKSAATASVFKAALTGGFKGFAIAAAAPWALPFWGLMPTVEAPGQAYSGAGYLTGPLVTVADRDCANRIRYELNVRLPAYGIDQSKWLTDAPWLYPQIKLQVIQLLKIATDLDVVEDDLDRAARAFDAVGEALMDLPQTLGVAFKATTDAGTTLGETLVWLAGGALAVFGVGTLIARRM